MRILAGWGILEPHPPRDDTPFLSLLTVELAVIGSGAGQRHRGRWLESGTGCLWQIADNQQ
jgi:hypothetical protein